MITQLHCAKTALYVFSENMHVISNNIANSQTVGFKSLRMEMENLFPLTFERVVTEFEQTAPTGKRRIKELEYGNGVHIGGISRDFTQGTIEQTNQPLDLAIKGNGFFQVRKPDGTLAYSRAGNFHIDRYGAVVHSSGYTLDPSLQIPQNTTEVIINDEGHVYVQMDNSPIPREIGQLMLAYFINPAGLSDMGQNLYEESAASGNAMMVNPGRDGVGTVQQRALEFSNVNIIEEMMQMIMTQRVVDVAVKAINACDAILKKGGGIGS